MKKKKLIVTIFVAGFLLAASVVQAMPIVANVTLVEDFDPSLVYFEGSLTTKNVGMAEILAQQVEVETINLYDVTASLPSGWVTPTGTNAFGDFLDIHFGTVIAFLNAAGTEIIGLTGTASNSTTPTASTLDLLAPTNATTPNYRWIADAPNNNSNANGESGIQVVPEPASIALLGIGLLGLGFARRKTAA